MKKVELRKRDHLESMANGVVDIRGDFYLAHRDEINHLIDVTVESVQATHPFERIVARYGNGAELIVEVTSRKLAERLGRTLNRVYGGRTVYTIMHDTQQARVFWERGGSVAEMRKSPVAFRPRKRGMKVR